MVDLEGNIWVYNDTFLLYLFYKKVRLCPDMIEYPCITAKYKTGQEIMDEWKTRVFNKSCKFR